MIVAAGGRRCHSKGERSISDKTVERRGRWVVSVVSTDEDEALISGERK